MIKKAYSPTGGACQVTFARSVPPEVNAQTVCLCGEFNEWNQTSHPMERGDDGGFSLTIDLEPGQQYRFRYLLDGERWENDWAADAYTPNPFGSDDSVVQI